MNQIFRNISVIVVICYGIENVSGEDWTRFRGPDGSGVAHKTSVPTVWDIDTNIQWKIPLPGPGSSCPIIYGDRVYVTCYTGYGVDAKEPGNVADLKRHLLCFDRSDGAERWRATVDSEHDEVPYQGFITHHGYASSTPVTDGQHIFVQFGKTGLVAFDMDGKQVWKQNVGTMSDPAKWGNGASCVLYKDVVIINAGNTGQAIVALNKTDGSEVWRVTDETFTNSWSTPVIIRVDNRDELIINMPGKILAYDPANGNELWWSESPITQTVCGSCVVHDGIVYAMGGREGAAIAVRAGGQGNVTDSHVVWNKPLRSGINTPLIANGRLYWISTGIAHCADCQTGEYVYRERLQSKAVENSGTSAGPSGDYASPVALDDKILLLTKSGTTHVIQASQEFRKIAENSFEGDAGRFNATPAIGENQMFVRSDNMLYCIAK